MTFLKIHPGSSVWASGGADADRLNTVADMNIEHQERQLAAGRTAHVMKGEHQL
jgi:hypothetical protein